MHLKAAEAIKMNVPLLGDKHVNKTCGAGGGEQMGRSHPRSRPHTLESQRSPRPGGAARTPLPTLRRPSPIPASAARAQLEFAGSRWTC